MCRFNLLARLPSHHLVSRPPAFQHAKELLVWENIVTESEEASLMAQIDKTMLRRRFESSHWDHVIFKYREMERPLDWFDATNKATLSKLMEAVSTHQNCTLLPQFHILDYAADGYLDAHVDSVKFSGNLVCGLSLLSSRVMRWEKLLPDSQPHTDTGNEQEGAWKRANVDPLLLMLFFLADRFI